VTGITDFSSVYLYVPTQSLVWRLDMTERRITRLFGLVLGAIFTCTLVLNAFAF
jgi:hypothetical protein